ncbi:MAG: class IV adenylate cyclase [Nanoarchaeota archaeon]
MSADNKEIEIKIPLTENEFFELKERLRQIATMKNNTKHVDTYFTPPHRDFSEPQYPFEFFSIRKRGDKTILNYKHFHPPNSPETTHCDEFETEITNAEGIEKIISLLNFRQLVVVEKERETFIYKDDFEICMDKVKDLGFFIEIEAMKSFDGVEDTRNKLFEFAESLGIDTSKTAPRGYVCMLMKKGQYAN